jgi:hypothetical protein
MESTRVASRRLSWQVPGMPADLGAWTLGFAVVAYLALSGGAYDAVVRDEAGIAVWWVVLVGVVAGVLRPHLGRLGWTAIGALTLFGAWTALGLTWTESAERTVAEIARVSTYLGVFGLAALVVARRGPRPVVHGVATGMGVVIGLAVLSRLVPTAFPHNDHFEFLGEAVNRLAYPLNYWNGLAAFASMTFALGAGLAVSARTRVGQASAAAVLPLAVLCVYFTASRAGAPELAVAIVALLLVSGDRLAATGTLLIGAAGGAVLVWAASQRPELISGVPDAAARSQGRELVVLCLVVCAGGALLQIALGLVARHAARPSVLQPSPRATAVRFGGALAIGVVIALAIGLPGTLQRSFREFRSLGGTSTSARVAPARSTADTFSRLQAKSISGNGRWQYWMSSVDAMQGQPLTGTGPGTFELWWARNADIPSYVRDAHSLYFETLGELGVPGLILLASFVLLVVVGGGVRALRTPPSTRGPTAAAVAACAVFAVAAAVDWAWEIGAIPSVFMLLGAAALVRPVVSRPSGRPVRGLVAVVAIVGLVAVAIPLTGTAALRRSQQDAHAGRLADAYREARTAQRVQPYAAAPYLQQALVLERAGDLKPALVAARHATANEPTGWRNWLVRARLEARAGASRAAVASFRRARSLNPQSPIMRTR